MVFQKPKLICTTPIRNEAKVLGRFIECASMWADYIIISDQLSEDNSIEIANKYPKVILIKNSEYEYNEKQVRQLLIDKAREIKGDKIIFAVDADEVLTPEIISSEEINKILNSVPGTIFMAQFVNICPDLSHFWEGPLRLPLAFHDDGSSYEASDIHTLRNICPENALRINLNHIKIMHFQFTDWDRMESKHRWYQCYERIKNPALSALRIYRSYHHMYSVKKKDLKIIPENWFDFYLNIGVDLKIVLKDKYYYWDKRVLEYFNKYGTSFFTKEAIWDINWESAGKHFGFENAGVFKDPRNVFQKIIQFWLKKTQLKHMSLPIRAIDKVLVEIFKY